MSEENSSQEKSFEPTDKKISDARKKGQVILSKDLTTFMIYFAFLISLVGLAGTAARDVLTALYPFIDSPDKLIMINQPDAFKHALMDLVFALFKIFVPIFFILISFTILSIVMQNAFVFSQERITPKLEKISPLAGFKKIYSLKSLVEFIKSLIKLTIITVSAYIIIVPEVKSALSLVGSDPVILMTLISENIFPLVLAITIASAVIGFADYFYQRYEHLKKLKMTFQEMKDESKETNGSPEIKAKIAQLRRERASRRMMEDVKDSSFVLMNPTHYAFAMKFDKFTQPVPMCTAKAMDEMALNIRRIAEENNIPVIENPPLTRALYATYEIGEEINQEHYEAIAGIINYIRKQEVEKKRTEI